MLREYNSPTRQLRVRNSLESLRIANFIIKGISPGKALETINCTISNLALQGPEDFRRDLHYIGYLRDSVPGADSAKGPPSRVESENGFPIPKIAIPSNYPNVQDSILVLRERIG
jgi:hypothetical protein